MDLAAELESAFSAPVTLNRLEDGRGYARLNTTFNYVKLLYGWRGPSRTDMIPVTFQPPSQGGGLHAKTGRPSGIRTPVDAD